MTSPTNSLFRPLQRLALLALLLAGLSACASRGSAVQTTFDLGALGAATPAPATQAPPAAALSALSVADISVPVWMDSTDMMYRLNYADPQQLRPYANSRWSMPPAALLGQRLKWRIAQSGGAVLSTADNRQNVLRIEADDFSQSFASPSQSHVQVALRVTLLAGRRLVAQKTFVQGAASDPNAAGSARALAQASDAAIDAIIAWLATQPLNP